MAWPEVWKTGTPPWVWVLVWMAYVLVVLAWWSGEQAYLTGDICWTRS